MKHLLPHIGIFVATCIVSTSLCLNSSFAFPISDSSNLVQNSSFESNNQPTLQFWDADTSFRKFVQDAPLNGGQWSLQLETGYIFGGFATTYVAGQSGVGVYELSVWMKNTAPWAGQVSFGQWAQNAWIKSKKTYCDSTHWTQISLVDTFSLQPSDTIAVELYAGRSPVKVGQVFFDLVSLKRTQSITTIKRQIYPVPKVFTLDQNYPNPFNPTTVINYHLANNDFVSLKIFDIQGHEVTTLVNNQQTAGDYSVSFSAKELKSGVYFSSLQLGQNRSVRKMLFIK